MKTPLNFAEDISASGCDGQFSAEKFYLKANRKAG